MPFRRLTTCVLEKLMSIGAVLKDHLDIPCIDLASAPHIEAVPLEEDNGGFAHIYEIKKQQMVRTLVRHIACPLLTFHLRVIQR